MTKRPSAQVEADVYLRWKLVHLFLPVQKLPSCCEAVWLSLCLRLSSAVRLDCILYLKCSYVWETKCLTVRHAAVFCCCFFHSVSLPYVIQSSSQVCLIDPTTESLHTHPRHRASSSSHSCLTFVETDWGFEGWHGGSVATVDWSLASLSRRCLFRAFVLGQKIRFLFFFFFVFFCFSGAKQRSRQYNMSTVSANHRTVHDISCSHYMLISQLSQQYVEGIMMVILQANRTRHLVTFPSVYCGDPNSEHLNPWLRRIWIPKLWCFLNRYPVCFVSKPNQSIKTVLWWIRIRNTAATRNVPFELCGFAEICLTKMYSGDWVCAETCSLSYLQLRCISMISHMLLVQLKQTRCISPVSAVGLSWC